MYTLKPGTQDGRTCSGDVNQVTLRYCSPDDDYELINYSTEVDGSVWFRCANGRYIAEALTCNGDDDCGDASDEYPNIGRNCTNRGTYICGIAVTTTTSNTPPKSDRYFLGIPGIEKLSGGFDILTGEFRGNVLSMRPFGSCRRVLKSGETDYYYRLPHNINSFSQQYNIFEAPGSIVTSGAELINATKALLGDSSSYGGILQDNDSYVGFSQSQKYKSYVLDSIARSNRFVAVTSSMKVKISKINMKSSSLLEVSDAFLRRLFELPQNYSYDRYMSFVKDFGTHYVSSATLGGEYTKTSIYDRCWLDQSGQQYGYEYEELSFGQTRWRTWLTYCDRENLRTKLNAAYTVPQTCATAAGENVENKITTTYVEVLGGSVSTAATLKDSLSSANWQAWVDTVAENPSFIVDDFRLERISRLLDKPIPNLGAEERIQIQANIEKAINDYLMPYNADTLCGGAKFSENCRDNICQYSAGDEASLLGVQNYTVRYLSGNGGAEYKCMCACLSRPDLDSEECGSVRGLPTMLTIVACLIITIKNMW